MKFSTIPVVGALLGVTSAANSQPPYATGGSRQMSYGTSASRAATCPPPSTVTSTVTQTVTVPAGGAGGGSGNTYTNTYTQPGNTYTQPGNTYTQPGNTYTKPGSTLVTSGNKAATTTTNAPYVATSGSQVVSVGYSGSATSVWVYPTGPQQSKDCTVAIYENGSITVVIINIYITIDINGVPVTSYSTVWNAPPPTTTPSLPPSSTGGSGSGSSSTTSTGGKATHSVVVGADGQLRYSGGQTVNAQIGDVIAFDFNSTNHTVTQSSFKEPCKPLAGGFDTGFNQFNNKNRTDGIIRPFTVTTTDPLWFYCAQPKGTHCQKGMVFGINPGNKFPEFFSRATNTATSIPLSTGGSVTAVASGTNIVIGGGAKATGSGAAPMTTGSYKYPALKARRAEAFAA